MMLGSRFMKHSVIAAASTHFVIKPHQMCLNAHCLFGTYERPSKKYKPLTFEYLANENDVMPHSNKSERANTDNDVDMDMDTIQWTKAERHWFQLLMFMYATIV